MGLAKVRENGADFLRYLHGQPVEHIGKEGKQTLAAISRALQECLMAAIAEHIEMTDEPTLSSTSPGKKRKYNDSDSLANPLILDIVDIVHSFASRASPLAKLKFESPEGTSGGVPDKLCRSWFHEFYADELLGLSLEDELPSKRIKDDISGSETSSTTSRSTECLLFSPEFRLDEHLDILLTSAYDERTRAVSDVCQVFLQVMIRWLENVSGVNVQRLFQSSSSEESLPEQTKRRIFDGWKDAWTTEYRGDALVHLEDKLKQLSHDVQNGSKDQSMSRLIPVVQASGAGKSRLAEMYLHWSTALTLVGIPQRILLSAWASAMAIVFPRG